MCNVVKELIIEKWGFRGPGEVGEFELIDLGVVHHGEDMIPVVIIVVAARNLEVG